MKILHRSKRALPPLPQVAELINKLSDTPNEDLHEVLGQIDSWKWPRSDLNAWIKVLNKFDAILEEVIQDYDIDKLQVNVFTPMTKKIVSEILRFERLLLENSTNRKTYASYDRINSLLSTSDLDILILALNLLLRPAQQYSAQPAVTRALSISTHRLQSLGKRWSNLREFDVSLVDLVTDQGRPVLEALPVEAREVQFKFYNTGKAKRSKDRANEMEVDPPETSQASSQLPLAPVSTGSSSQAAGAITLYFDTLTLSLKGAMDILADCIDTYNVPEDERFELMCRIRAAQALLPGREEEREKLVIARLLATAIFVHTHPETQTASALFLYEPDLIPHVAELLALDRNVPIWIQTAAVATLDAVARYRTKVQDVLAAVNAGVNHGTLMALLRKTVVEVATPESTLPHSFVEALLSFVIFLASHAAGGNMVVGAGLIPLLIQIIENRLPQRLAVVSKTMQLVDNVLYSFGNAFQLFCNNRGVEVLVDRIEYEVDEDIRTLGQQELPNDIPKSYGQLPVVRAAALKHILRSMHRMMQSSGTAEGLRGLIDSSLLKSIKKIIEHRSLFGPNVLPIAINILATFVHNEPTSLTVIQEAGVPEAFYRAVEAGLEPVIEVIQAIPNAIGALCLNQAGQDQLTARPTIIPGLFSIFTSERHQRVLQDKENAVLIGSAVDELIRHHPSLKSAVFEAIKSTLSKIEDLGNTFTPSESTESWYRLVRTTASTVPAPGDEDVLMRSSDNAPIDEAASEPTGVPNALTISLTDDMLDESATGRSHENIIVSYLDVICRFLEGLFQHTSHCKDFISNSDGLVLLGRLTALPCIPYDFGGSVASDSLVQVIRTMFDAAPNPTMNSLTSWVQESLQETSSFWGSPSRKSKFTELLDLAGQSHSEANRTFRTLITLLVRVILLSDIYATAGYAHGRSAGGLLQTLMNTGASEILPDLGILHRACIWENVLLKAQVPEKESGLEGNAILSSLQSPGEPSSSEPTIAANGTHTSSATVTPTGVSGQEGPRESDPREENAKSFRHLANQIPGALSPFFQSIVKLFSTRRNPDSAQKQQILESASSIADVLLKHLEPMESEDPTESLSIGSCYTSLLGLVTTLMVDERTAQNTLHTVLFDAFYRKGGLDSIVTICRSFIRTISEHSQTKAEDRTEIANQALGHAYGGIKVALHLLHSLTSSKPIFESSQTILLLTRDKKDTDPDYFEPHNFLVKTRLAVLPIVQELWEARWLVSSPQSLIKSVVQVVLEILNGEGEESPPEISPHTVPGAGPLSMGAPSLFRVAVPDENRVRQLTDMGFSRPSAERALIRTHNNVNAATELLLSNPFRFQNDPEPVASQSQEPGGSGEATTETPPIAPEVPPSDSTPIQDDVATPSPGDSQAIDSDSRPPGKSADEWRSELNTMREPLKSEVGRLALRLVDEYPELIFDVHNAFVGRDDGYQRSSVRLLIDDIPSFAANSQNGREQHLAVRCRLLALVLNEAPASFAATVMGDEQAFMEVVLTLLLSFSIDPEARQTTIPKWLAALMLVAEALLSLSEDPRSVTVPKEGEPIATQEILTGPPYVKARTVLFDFSLRLLALPSLPRDELLASLRLLVFMTRDHDLAMQFVKREGVSLLFKSLKSSSGGVAGSQSYISVILRHIVEDPVVLRHIMREEVQRFLSHPRTRTVDATGYVRACNALALRDPKAFIDVTKSLAQLERPFAYVSQIIPKDQDNQEGGVSSGESSKESKHTGAQAEITAHTLPSPPEYFEAVVHFLVGELVEFVRSGSRQSEGGSNPESTPPDASAEGSLRHPNQPERKPAGEAQDSKPDHYYSGFLMQSLTELMFSYDACKTAFLSYSPSKRSGIPSKDASKGRLAALNFVLSDLVSFRSIDPDPTHDARNKVPLCNWAMSLIVALCVDTSSSQPIKDVSPELIAVRKTVLEAVSRAIKDPSQSESLDARYGRLLALADLCYRLLTVRFNPGLRKPHEETPTHIAKIMLEKNFVSTLTNALAEVDLNYPNVRVVVAAMLKPLELLSKIAIKMNRASDRVKSSEESKDEMDQESLPEEDDLEDGQDTAREETPDLYRNSSLGMFGGDMEEQFAAEDAIDAEHGDEEDDVEMDFGEETGGSEGTSATEEDDEPDDPDDEEGDSEEDWHDEDEDEDLLEEDEENRAPEADGQVDPDVDVDGVWEGVGIEDAAQDVDPDEGDEDIAVPIYHHDTEEAEADLESDEELEGELGFDPQDDGPSIGDVLGFEGVVSDGFPGFIEAHDGGLIISGGSRTRRGRIDDDDIGILGRSRSTAAPADTTTHPLLLETTGNSGRHIPDLGRAVRRSQRILASGGHQDLLQAIEDIIGGGAVQLFQHIVNPRGGGVADTIRLDVPPGTLVNLDRGLLPRRAGVSASLRIDQPPRSVSLRPESREFDPFPTIQRWSEEAKVIHGKFAPDRFAKLGNHVVLALLPAAIEKAKATKEAKDAAEKEAAEKETAEREATEKEEAQRREAAAEAEESAGKTVEAPSQIPTPPTASPPALDIGSSSVPSAAAPPITSEADTEMLDATAESHAANEQDATDDDAGAPGATTDQEAGEAGPASGPERITVMIHGSPVDITDTGIDPTFLEALPDDMREEVVNQHIRDQQAARMERPPDSQISAEFLDALPPEIRAEILHQERIEQARRRAEERATAAPAGAEPAPVEMDPASFIASLDPQLRQDVLMDQDEGFIQTLPSHIIAEAGTYRERAPRRIPPVSAGSRTEGNTNAAITRKPQAPRDAIQLLDKSGVAVLVRLLFFPQISRKNILYKTLVNLCENSKTRAELFNFLLNILQEGTGDLAAIDRSFTQMTIRNSKVPTQLHRPAGKQKTGPEYLSSLPTHSPSEVVPDLIAQRCLEALSYIVTSNESSSLFFLTEQEMAVGLRRHSSKKGKGKEKQAAQTQYPIVLLLSLLDRQPLLKTPSVLELVVSLLDTVTRPLGGLKAPQKPEAAAVSTTPLAQSSEEAPSASLAEPNSPAPINPSQESQKDTPRQDAVEEKTLLIDPPQVPASALRSIVNILTVGDCGAKPFHHTLSLIQHLSFIPDTRDVVAQELRSKAQEFGQSLYHDLDELANSLQGQGDDVFTSSVASRFSSPASDQAKLLRVLKTIDYMFSPKATVSPEPQPTTDLEKIQGIYESFRFTPLWRRLGDCLSIIEQRSEIEHIATVLLPLIEALMVVCKYVGSASIPAGPSRMLRASASPRSPTTPRETMEDLFVSFTDAHRKVLNVMVRNNPSLMSGSFSLLVNNPRVLDFDNKRNYFNQQLHKRPHSREHHGTLQLNVRRQRVFEDSFQSLQRKTGEQIKYGKLSVRFYDEEGVDAGGVTREWFQILARQMFDPNNALFQPCAADRLTYQPSKASWVNPEHLSFFKFVGRVIGKAIYDGRLLDAYFARSLYRQILGKPVDYRDVEWIDPEYYNSLCWILENDPSPLDLNFSVEGDEFGVMKIVSLKENGESMPVTLENKREFVQLSAQYRLYTSIKDQLENLLSGFYEIIPKDLIAIFNEKELELLISGTPDIDVDEWRSATEYNGYTSSDPVIVWWWRALKSFNRDERAKVLSFATGTSRVPLGGFNDLQGVQGTQRFSIHRAYGDPDRLPQAHTCFNQIDLPQYSSYEMLRQQLLLAINEGGEGFGFA